MQSNECKNTVFCPWVYRILEFYIAFLFMKLKVYLALVCSFSFFCSAKAQMPHDAIYMPKGTACLAVTYGKSSWSQYWENTLKRENLNIGTLTAQSVMPMVAVGLTEKLNVLVAVPYVTTKANAGNLMGQKGIQDLSLWLKYKFFYNDAGFSLHGVGGVSTPVSNYVADFLPMSIGFKSKNAMGRLMANYYHKSGLYLTGHGSYTFRSNIRVDRDAYLAYGKMYHTDEVAMPNTTDAAFRLGYLRGAVQVETFIERNACVEGDNIRRNDMPFPTNNMRMTLVGAYAKFQPKNIGFNARVNYVTAGLNVGQSFGYSIGLLYQINNIKF